jgi:peptide/nickel transport system substrate-binding protein
MDGSNTELRLSRRQVLRLGVAGLGLIGLGAACAPAPATPAGAPAAAPASAPAAAPAAAPAVAPGAPAAPKTASGAAPSGKLVVFLGVEPVTLDLHLVTNARIQICDSVLESLVIRDPDMKLQPNLATSWERMDPTRVRFKLQQGVKFHNGEPFNANAVVVAIKRVTDPANKSTLLAWVDSIEAAVPVDDYTVDIVTRGPDTILVPRMVFLPMMAPDATMRNPAEAGEKPIGTGPYRVAEWTRGQRILLTANDEYWGPIKPSIKEVEIASRKESQVRLTALKVGEAHLIDNVTPEDTALLPKEQVVSVRSTETLSLRMNAKTGVTTDKRVRQAIHLAIDRPTILKDIYQGFADSANGQLYNDLTFGFEPALKDYPFDLDKAKQLVQEAGAVGKEIILTGASANRWLKDREIQEAVAAMIGKSGLQVNLKLMELVDANKAFYEIENPVVQGTFTSPSSDMLDVDRVLANYAKTGGRASLYSNPEMDRLFEVERAELEPAKRMPILQQMTRLVYDDLPIMSIGQPRWIYGVNPKLKFYPYPTGLLTYHRMTLAP